MSSEITRVSSGGIVQKPLPALSQTTVDKSDFVPTMKPAFKVDLPASPKVSFDRIQDRQNIKDAVSFLNEQLSANSRGIGFTVNEGNSTPIVTVRNTKTGEVVRQIPNDVVIKIAQNIDSSKGSFEDKAV
jgi:flagellar protein FlaG